MQLDVTPLGPPSRATGLHGPTGGGDGWTALPERLPTEPEEGLPCEGIARPEVLAVQPEGGVIVNMSWDHVLTGMPGTNPQLFAAGVDVHGVHDWTTERARGLMNRERYETAPDFERALEIAWRSSPVSSMATWRSPVFVIHGDDDRNVRFAQSVDLVRRLAAQGVPYEELVIPDDTHHWMLHGNAVRVGEATAAFFDRTLRGTGRVSLTGSDRR